MSKYTTEVRFICENYAGYNAPQDYPISDVIAKSRTKIFDFDFPIYDESYRSVLETKILMHYYTREIGFETVALWKHWLDMRLNEIMPYYNQLYQSNTLEFNPLYDVDITTTGNRKDKYDEKHNDTDTAKNIRTDALKEETQNDSLRTDNLAEATESTSDTTTAATRTDNLASHSETQTSGTTYDLYSDTPQGALSGVDSEEYLTNARKATDNSTESNDGTNTGTVKNDGTQNVTGKGSTKNTGTQDVSATGSRDNTGTQTHEENRQNDGARNYTNTNDYLEHVAGKRNGMTYSKMLEEYRATFINIDTMIINELSDLFMNVW